MLCVSIFLFLHIILTDVSVPSARFLSASFCTFFNWFYQIKLKFKKLTVGVIKNFLIGYISSLSKWAKRPW